MNDPSSAFLDIVGVRVLARYVLELTFETGEVKVIDVEPELYGTAFAALRDDDTLFRAVAVDPEAGRSSGRMVPTCPPTSSISGRKRRYLPSSRHPLLARSLLVGGWCT